MRATVMYGAGDVRVDDVPDATIHAAGAICGSDLWPYRPMPQEEHGRRMGHEFLGVVEEVGAPFVWADNACDFCREGLHTFCRHGGRWASTSTADRARRCASPRRRARW